MITPLFLDTETFSEIDIRSSGAAKYARHPSTECLMLTWCLAHGPVYYHDLTAGPIPTPVVEMLIDPNYTKIAHNAPFDKDILEHTLGIATLWDSWMDSQALAYSLGFSGSLGDIQKQLGIEEEKAKIAEGRKLIQRFSKPQPKNHNVRRWTKDNDIDGWLRFAQYAVRDTESMRDMWNAMAQYGSMSDYEWQAWRDTCRMNDMGMPIDTTLVTNAIEMTSIRKNELKNEMIKLTSLPNPNSNQQLLPWLQTQGIDLPNLQAATVDNALSKIPDSVAKTVLKLKRTVSQTAVTKWNSIQKMLCDDNTVKGQFQYRGASRTGRDASRGINLQNLRRPPKGNMDELVNFIYDKDLSLLHLNRGEPLDFLAGTVRGAITAPPGKMLLVSDLSSIESRVLGWLARCVRMNNIFANGLDTYKDYATELFHCSYSEVTKEQRTFSKPPVLGAGYMMGGRGLAAYADSMGVPMTQDEAQNAVSVFREAYPEIPELWSWLMDSIEYVLTTGNPVSGYHLTLALVGDFMTITLPSGRNIYYHKPEWRMWSTPVGERMSFTYMGINRFKSQPTWERIAAHAGGVVENIVQAIARDILIEWHRRCRTMNIIGRVHDELLAIVDEDMAEAMLGTVNASIASGIDWAPGLLLAAEGFIAKHYTKD